MGTYATGPDPAIGAETFYICRRIEEIPGRNAPGYCNPKLDELPARRGRSSIEKKCVVSFTTKPPRSWPRTCRTSGFGIAIPSPSMPAWTGLPGDPTGYGPFIQTRWIK